MTSDSRVCFFCFLSFTESFVVEQQTLFGVDLIHISMIPDVKVQCQGRGVGANLGSLEYVYTYYKKGHQPGVYVPLRALFLVIFAFLLLFVT